MKIRILLLLVVLGLAALILPNVRALYEGIFFYLRDVVTYRANDVTPINRAGRYASLYDLVAMRNADRLQYLKHRLGALNVVVDNLRKAPQLLLDRLGLPDQHLKDPVLDALRQDGDRMYGVLFAFYDHAPCGSL